MSITDPYRPLVCGTKRTERRPGANDYRVVCATCGAGGSVRYLTHAHASARAIALSNQRCKSCGAS